MTIYHSAEIKFKEGLSDDALDVFLACCEFAHLVASGGDIHYTIEPEEDWDDGANIDLTVFRERCAHLFTMLKVCGSAFTLTRYQFQVTHDVSNV